MKYIALTKRFDELAQSTGRPLVTEAATYCNVHRATINRLLRKKNYTNDKLAEKVIEFLTVIQNDELQLQTTLQYLAAQDTEARAGAAQNMMDVM